jgi:heme-degrading monooxygenase HmoA
VVSVTCSEAIPRHIPAFLRASRPVEEQVLNADGLLWTMGFFKPPTWFSTVTIWRSSEATDAFAYSQANGGAHREALPLVHNWFKRSTTMRFRPYDTKGSLSGDHPLTSSLVSPPTE